MDARNLRYSIDGWRVEIRPGRFLPCVIYFEYWSKVFRIAGLDLYSPDREDYLGWVPGANISLDTQALMRDYIKKHQGKWQRLIAPENQAKMFD